MHKFKRENVDQNELKSDYFRIEIYISRSFAHEYLKLKSDYFRIEILIVGKRILSFF